MSQQIYKIPRVMDGQIADALSTLATEFGPYDVTIHVLETALGQIRFPEAEDSKWKELLSYQSDLISYFAGTIRGVILGYHRGGSQGHAYDKSPIFDELSIDTETFDLERVSVAARCLELFRPVQLPRPSDSIALLENQRAIQEATFSRLARQSEHLFEQTVQFRAQIDEQVRTKEESLILQFTERTKAAQAEIETIKLGLESERAKLEERRKTLDDSDNTFARRQIRDRMLDDVASRVSNFGVSAATSAARSPVASGMLLLASFFMVIFVLTFYELWETRGISLTTATQAQAPSTSTSPHPSVIASAVSSSQAVTPTRQTATHEPQQWSTERLLLWLRLTLVSIGVAASVIYYIRWQNQWASSFAAAEQALQHFHIDVNRANWVVETCLEWRKETQADVPAHLVESLTRGLFASRDSQQQVLHPADELASALMGSASKLSLDLGGSKVEIDKPKTIPKTIAASSDKTT
jgi:hypothetical protein